MDELLSVAWQQFTERVDVLELEHAFKAIVHTAIMAERERCAQIAESFIPSGFTGTHGVARDDRARTIASAIRQQPKA